jgi:type IV secretory pathway protease TraF
MAAAARAAPLGLWGIGGVRKPADGDVVRQTVVKEERTRAYLRTKAPKSCKPAKKAARADPPQPGPFVAHNASARPSTFAF